MWRENVRPESLPWLHLGARSGEALFFLARPLAIAPLLLSEICRPTAVRLPGQVLQVHEMWVQLGMQLVGGCEQVDGNIYI
jgi:hypothetical protein